MVSFTQFVLAAPAEFIGPALEGRAPDLPNFEVGSDQLARRQDYTQNYKTSDSVSFKLYNSTQMNRS